MALQWCLSRWYVTSTIIGATTIEQLQVAMFPAKVCVLLNALDSMTIQLTCEFKIYSKIVTRSTRLRYALACKYLVPFKRANVRMF